MNKLFRNVEKPVLIYARLVLYTDNMGTLLNCGKIRRSRKNSKPRKSQWQENTSKFHAGIFEFKISDLEQCFSTIGYNGAWSFSTFDGFFPKLIECP